MKLSICIVHYHCEEDLEQFLKSLKSFPPSGEYEVIVVNNGGKEGFAERIWEHFGPNIRIIDSGRNLGFGAAMNLAAKEAKGEFLFLGNPDLEVQQGSFEKLLEFAEKKSDMGLVGPRLSFPDGGVQQSCRRFPALLDLAESRLRFLPFFQKRAASYLMEDTDLSRPLQVDWLVGAALLIRRERFLEIGGFDERFFLFFEDTDLCRRLKGKGYSIWYDPEAVFLHSRERLSERGFWPFRKVFWIHLASALKYFSKWGYGV